MGTLNAALKGRSSTVVVAVITNTNTPREGISKTHATEAFRCACGTLSSNVTGTCLHT
jgi:hypothetical protein